MLRTLLAICVIVSCNGEGRCKDNLSSVVCVSSGCKWDISKECVDAEPVDCSSFGDESECLSSNCRWAKSKCKSPKCSSFKKDSECLSSNSNCRWLESKEKCKAHKCTLKNKKEKCLKSDYNCKWSKEKEKCKPVATATCNDGKKNQDEEDVDCGGPCESCPTCNDGKKNQGEEDVDCGGPCESCQGEGTTYVFAEDDCPDGFAHITTRESCAAAAIDLGFKSDNFKASDVEGASGNFKSCTYHPWGAVEGWYRVGGLIGLPCTNRGYDGCFCISK